jgi:hypothetical protein
MVIGAIRADQEAALRDLLATMNRRPGIVDPDNKLFPFAQFPQLHVARFVILNDETLSDLPPGDVFPHPPVWLAFLGDCDGDAAALLDEAAAKAGDGLRQIFSHCADFPAAGDLRSWLYAHSVTPAAQYINWVGRTVQQIREEAALHGALADYLANNAATLAGQLSGVVRDRLVAEWRKNGPTLTPRSPTPPAEQLAHIADLAWRILLLIVLSPLALLYAPFFLWQLRRHETADPEIVPRPAPEHVEALAVIEDHDVTNQFSAFGNVKPGRFRLWTLIAIFFVLELGIRLLYTRGRLARVGTIHFARWVFLDDKRRLFFGSNYDGSLDSYMDDFINKVAYGLNLVFSNGIGYPKTSFLLCHGAEREMQFKYYLRRHQLPSQVWYKAYPDLTTADLARNTMIREGLEAPTMSESDARQWLALI